MSERVESALIANWEVQRAYWKAQLIAYWEAQKAMCTGECEQPAPDKAVKLVPTVYLDLESIELAPQDHSMRFLDPWKGDDCPKGVPCSPRCEVCDCAECRYCGAIRQIG